MITCNHNTALIMESHSWKMKQQYDCWFFVGSTLVLIPIIRGGHINSADWLNWPKQTVIASLVSFWSKENSNGLKRKLDRDGLVWLGFEFWQTDLNWTRRSTCLFIFILFYITCVFLSFDNNYIRMLIGLMKLKLLIFEF